MTRTLNEAAQAAKLIREDLKKQKINYKTVTSKTYTGGDSVYVTLVDQHPIVKEQVNLIVKKYEQCAFDGMQDLKIYLKHEDKSLPRADYIFVYNNVSQELNSIIHKYIDLDYCQKEFYPESIARDRVFRELFEKSEFWNILPNLKELIKELIKLENNLQQVKNQPCTSESIDQLNYIEDKIEDVIKTIKRL